MRVQTFLRLFGSNWKLDLAYWTRSRGGSYTIVRCNYVNPVWNPGENRVTFHRQRRINDTADIINRNRDINDTIRLDLDPITLVRRVISRKRDRNSLPLSLCKIVTTITIIHPPTRLIATINSSASHAKLFAPCYSMLRIGRRKEGGVGGRNSENAARPSFRFLAYYA